MSSKTELKRHKNYALSDQEVIDLVKGKAKVVTYDQLHKYGSINELLPGPHDAVFLLYQQDKSYGHWVALFKRTNKKGNVEIEHFCPYGTMIDDPLLWTTKSKRKELHMDYPYLSKLLLKAPRNYEIIYNQYPFQKMGKGINTCGRHAVMRLRHKDLSLNEYKNRFIKALGGNIRSKKTDDLVTELTMFEI